MSLATYALSGCELFFTVVKSLLLGAPCGQVRVCAILPFVIESVVGLVLTVLLLIVAWQLDTVANSILRAGAVLILVTEALSAVAEAHAIHSKLRGLEKKGDDRGKRRKAALRLFALIAGTAVLILSFFDDTYEDPGRTLIVVRAVMGSIAAQLAMLTAVSIIWRRKYVMRVVLALLFLLVDLIFATAALASGKLVIFPGHHLFEFRTHVSISVFFLAAASAITAGSSYRLTSYKVAGEVNVEQATFVETVVFATAPPVVVIALTERARDGAVKVLLTVLPQIAVHLGPLVVGYMLSCCSCCGGVAESACSERLPYETQHKPTA